MTKEVEERGSGQNDVCEQDCQVEDKNILEKKKKKHTCNWNKQHKCVFQYRAIIEKH